jgi:hypothetical protein
MEVERLGEALKGAVDLSIRYYAGLLKLSTDYLQSLGTLVSAAGSAATPPPAAGAAAAPPRPPLLLAAVAGEDATAAFLIENTLGERVTARVVVRGGGVAGHVTARPEVVSLRSGEQCVIQVRVPVDGAIEVGRDHIGELAVPELASRTIPFVVRRLPGESGAAPEARADPE